ncbi:MAG: hypothetical protein HY854_03950 [Burkholderiales bacterium]|nr:hypothetical protein [Burkholderiales bacterium]
MAAALLLAACGGGRDEPRSAIDAMRAAAMPSVAKGNAAPVTSDVATIAMDWAEATFPALFPGHPANQTSHPFIFRYYAGTGAYLGIVYETAGPYAEGDVYVLGGPFGSAPVRVGPLAAYLVTNYFVDGPVKGLVYACSPSGLAGTTGSNGAFTCRPGENVSFLVYAGTGGTINLGTTVVPSVSGVHLPATVLPGGVAAAAVLHALNHGSTSNLDVSGLTLTPSAVAAVNAFIASSGTNLSGHASPDQLLAAVQAQTTGATLTSPVTGTGYTFLVNTVLPHLQSTIIGISQVNPPPAVQGGTSKLSGTIVVTGSGTFETLPGAPDGTVTFSGGGILNATINGDISVPGIYQATWSSPGFVEVVKIHIPQFTLPGTDPPIIIPAYDETMLYHVPPLSGSNPITVTAAFSGTNLSLPAAAAPPGFVAGPVSGTNIGLANPLVTLTTFVSGTVEGANVTATATAKLVGSW